MNTFGVDSKNETVPSEGWDWIVVGTGIGGSTFGYALARAGKRVLFIEQGADQRNNKQKKSGQFLESIVPNPGQRKATDFENAGRSRSKIWDAVRQRWIKPILGSGTGGSSALYGMVMERFWKEDFKPGPWHRGTGSSAPDRWPIRFDEMEPFYHEAEGLFGVSSLRSDPLRNDQTFNHVPRPPLTSAGQTLMTSLEKNGLHPYTLPLARQWGTRCVCCQSHLCDHDCKNDAAKMCLGPALHRHDAALLTGATVTKILAEETRVTGVRVQIGGEIKTFYADNVALAAGALFTPALLLKSRSSHWPKGLANRSGMVGRNLMRHFIDFVGIPSKASSDALLDQKEIGLNDFYQNDGKKGGTLADFGAMPPLPVVLEDLDDNVASSGAILRFLWRLVRPLVGWGLGRLFKHRRFMALILEDLPYLENRVEVGTQGADIVIHSTISTAEKKRIDQARASTKKRLGLKNVLWLKNAHNTKLLAHACGTCRMGDDPTTNVVDRFNRAHDLENLYVVDASFFPSSAGVNPALTIAANALRVADHLIEGAESKGAREEAGFEMVLK